jgi:hypothetical protein
MSIMATPQCDTPLVSVPNRTSRSKTISSTNWITETTDRPFSTCWENDSVNHHLKTWKSFHWRSGNQTWSEGLKVSWCGMEFQSHCLCLWNVGLKFIMWMVVLLVLFHYLFFPWGENLHTRMCNCNTKTGY